MLERGEQDRRVQRVAMAQGETSERETLETDGKTERSKVEREMGVE